MQTGMTDERVQALEQELERVRADAADGWTRYHALRYRKAVRALLVLLRVSDRVRRRIGRPGAPAPAPLAPATPAAATAPDAPDAPAAPEEEPVRHGWDLGHYYSPVPDTRELAREPMRSRVWPPDPPERAGVDFRDAAQVELARAISAQPPLEFPTASTGDPTVYHTGNEFFSRLDAWALQGVLRHFRPARMIEVGCGWSSLVTAQVNREHLGGELDFTCIEPYPQPFLDEGIDGITRLIVAPVQDVPPSTFGALGDGDVLFIDTSHVVKTGGDVPYLYHEVLPRLNPGVLVHVHDIFFPWDYPRDWVLVGRGWNEQYLLQSFLTLNSDFDVLLGIGWLNQFHPGVLAAAIPGYPRTTPDGGASFWMRRRS